MFAEALVSRAPGLFHAPAPCATPNACSADREIYMLYTLCCWHDYCPESAASFGDGNVWQHPLLAMPDNFMLPSPVQSRLPALVGEQSVQMLIL